MSTYQKDLLECMEHNNVLAIGQVVFVESSRVGVLRKLNKDLAEVEFKHEIRLVHISNIKTLNQLVV